MSEEAKVKCPRCGSDLVVRISTQLHCNACSFDFAQERIPAPRTVAFIGWPTLLIGRPKE